MVVDTLAAIELLNRWIKEGHENMLLFAAYERDQITVASLHSNQELMDLNRSLQKDRIEPNIGLLKAELGLKEEDFIRVPCLFDENGSAIVPNMVNSTLLNGHIFIMAPEGPVVKGEDLLEAEMRRLLEDLPLELLFLEGGVYHMWGGEVHCATNVRREGPSTPWWQVRLSPDLDRKI